MKERLHTLDKKIAENLKAIRILENKTLQEVAVVLDVSKQQYSKYERGIDRLTFSKAYIIAQFFKVNIEDLVN